MRDLKSIHPEDGGIMVLRNTDILPRRPRRDLFNKILTHILTVYNILDTVFGSMPGGKWERKKVLQLGAYNTHVLYISLYIIRNEKYFKQKLHTLLKYVFHVTGPFAKFVDSPYYSESELCGGAVTVSCSKYLLWQAMHLLQRSTHFSKTCCRPFITSKFLASELPFHGWKSPEIARGKMWIEFCVRFGKSRLMMPH
jgi:hypothetical protein